MRAKRLSYIPTHLKNRKTAFMVEPRDAKPLFEMLKNLLSNTDELGKISIKARKYYEENNLMTSAKMGLTEDKLFGIMLGFDK